MTASFFPSLLYCLVNAGVLLCIAPLFMGIIRKVKARAQGRRGPPLLYLYYSLFRLWRKESLYSLSSSWIIRITPFVCLGVIILSGFFVPVIVIPTPFSGIGNIILFLYLLALYRIMTALSGLDAGSSFGGMGSSREMSLSPVIEPTIIVVAAALSSVLGTLNIFEMMSVTADAGPGAIPPLILVAVSLFLILIIETSRIPVDNPETHLELTMVHEAMVLEFSGRDLALMELSHAMKQAILMAFLIGIIIPFGIIKDGLIPGVIIATALFVLKGSVIAVLVGVFESYNAKLRFFSIPTFFMLAFFFSSLTLIIEVFA